MEESVPVSYWRNVCHHISFSDRIPVFSAIVAMVSETGKSESVFFGSYLFLHVFPLWHRLKKAVLRQMEDILKDF